MMTQQSPPTKSRTGWKTLERLSHAARAILAFERLWPLLWPASGIAGLFLALAWLGLPQNLPWPLQALLLAGFVTAIGLSLAFSLENFSWPSARDAARRLESDNNLSHRPLSEAHDRLAAGAGDAIAEDLWHAHRRAQSVSPDALRLNIPDADLSRRDPHALRFIVLAAIGLGFIVAWGHWGGHLAAAFGPAAGSGPRNDVWIDPPAYTGEAPVYLTEKGVLAVPAGSTLNIRVHGATRAPYLSLSDPYFPYLSWFGDRLEGESGEFSRSLPLIRDAKAKLRADGQTLGIWRLSVIPDLAPTVAFTAKPGRGSGGLLTLAYLAQDDYAVTQLHAMIRPVDGSGPPLMLDLAPPQSKAIRQSFRRDLTAHAYAGQKVEIVLVAADACGQIALSEVQRATLPALYFTDPLARALVELRRDLVTKGWAARTRTLRLLDAFAIAPELFYAGQSSVYLALRTAYWGLHHARSEAELPRIEALLWQTAAAIEHGGMRFLAEALRRLQREIGQLMQAGAPQADIDAALERYAQLLQRYLQLMAQSAPKMQAEALAKAKTLGVEDLADLLEAIQQMAQSGDRERAAQLLAFLQNLIENMRMSAGGAGQSAHDKTIQELSDLMGRQRQLLDKTFRESQRAGDPKDGGPSGLARQQDTLKDDLAGQIGKMKKPNQDLKQAEKLMGNAAGALRLGDLPRAGTLQKYVLDALRKAATAMSAQKNQGQAQSDPLGRQGGAGGDGPELPDADVIRRARDILLELRKRAGEMNRPKEERDYIDRLLKQF